MKRTVFSGLLLFCAMVLMASVMQAQTSVVAAVHWPGDKVQFFLNDGTYVRYDVNSGHPDAGYPKRVDNSSWNGLGGHSIVTAFNGLNGKVYFFFADDTYSRYDIAADRVDPGYPQQVTDSTWPGLGRYVARMTGAVNWNSSKVYIFLNDGTYLRYDLVADRTDAGYPMRIDRGTWPGLAPYADHITSAVNWNGSKAYIFLDNDTYLRYDIAADHVDSGYPQAINGQNWPGLSGYFHRRR